MYSLRKAAWIAFLRVRAMLRGAWMLYGMNIEMCKFGEKPRWKRESRGARYEVRENGAADHAGSLWILVAEAANFSRGSGLRLSSCCSQQQSWKPHRLKRKFRAVKTSTGHCDVQMRKTLLGLFLLLLGTAVSSFPQNNESIVSSSQIPPELRGSLISRLNLFLSAQAENRWNYVSSLLGNSRSALVRDVPYTSAHRACLLSAMKASPMVEFALKEVRESPYNSWRIQTASGPAPMARSAWVLFGEASFRSDSGTVKKFTSVIAYRDKEKWYLTPAAVDNVELTREELLRDRKDEVQLLIPADCPLELIDLRVRIDPKNVGSRDVHFRLRNRTNQRVTRYGFVIDDEQQQGSISYAAGANLEPGGVTDEFNETHVLYSFWRCEGEPPIRIQIDHVGLADGTEWRPPKLLTHERKAK